MRSPTLFKDYNSGTVALENQWFTQLLLFPTKSGLKRRVLVSDIENCPNSLGRQ
ncbi:hypothetical protein NG796_20645 [Laspinema sp. A4]|uniref:hypothetical protein n=1 Tax=Laspinema sp. D2d TaxID=2953686 RepID=UPI0021BBAEBC|nr:hypothetical protein [Laspinema sp. D2d]MCT7985685.1 hypothetical protein [Laspinema sp. D2d]